jgi:transposase
VHLDAVDLDGEQVTLTVSSHGLRAACPVCGRRSRRVHSRYWRTLADRPWNGRPVRLRLRVRRYRCGNAECPRCIFTERLPELVAPQARRTKRLGQDQQEVGFAVGARPGAKLARRLGMPLSARTLSRLLHAAPCPEWPNPRVLGIDEWAWRRGQRYGTILVDLERSQPVDLLPDRDAESVARWLRAHPGIEVVSRDRSRLDADGIARGAPGAKQVVDRWHLLRNLGQALEHVLDRKLAARRAAVPQPEQRGESGDSPRPAERGPRLTAAERESQRRRTKRLARYEEVHALAASGVGLMAIAAHLGMAHQTVRRYLRADCFPERAPRTGDRSALEPYKPYLRERWDTGCRTGVQLYKELKDRGYTHSRVTVSRFVAELRRSLPVPAQADASGRPTPPAPALSARQVARLVLRRPAQRTNAETAYLERLAKADQEVEAAITLAQAFADMLRTRQGEQLDAWLLCVAEQPVPELAAFAAGLGADEAAVRAGLTEPWSTGPVEGQITRLKLIKRQGYGRAGFALLRQRVLHGADNPGLTPSQHRRRWFPDRPDHDAQHQRENAA